jgi:two-component system, LytTR family, response regulator
MKKIKTLIVDDESLAREDLAELVAQDPEIEIVGLCADGEQALAALRQQAIDLLFLDVQMPGLTGFEVLGRLGVRPPHVVFVTAYVEHALRAFEVGALDYISKPFTRARLSAALARAKEKLEHEDRSELSAQIEGVLRELSRLKALSGEPTPVAAPAPASGAVSEEPDLDGRFLFRSDGEIHVCTPADIRWVETVGDYVKLHLGEKNRLVRMTMLTLMQKLERHQFVRIHRSTAVNLRHVRKVSPALYGEYTVELLDGTKLKVSRTYMPVLRAAL